MHVEKPEAIGAKAAHGDGKRAGVVFQNFQLLHVREGVVLLQIDHPCHAGQCGWVVAAGIEGRRVGAFLLEDLGSTSAGLSH